MKRFFACLFILLIGSCSKIEESNIPYALVYLNIDLRYQDKDLVGLYNYKYITTARTAGEKTGYAGVLVVCGIDGYGNTTYYAFDRCCPHEANKKIIAFIKEIQKEIGKKKFEYPSNEPSKET